MPIDNIVSLLIAERDRIDAAITALTGETPVAKRRGRPAKKAAAVETKVDTPPTRKKRTFTPEQRAEQAARMKKFWAKKKRATKKGA